MKRSHRIAALVAREARRFVAIATERAALVESIRKRSPSFRPLTDSETAAILDDELLSALSGVRRHA